MGKFSLLIVACNICYSSFGQSIKKNPIGASGCSAYFFCAPAKFDLSCTDDSPKVYTGDCKAADSLTYGMVCINLKRLSKIFSWQKN